MQNTKECKDFLGYDLQEWKRRFKLIPGYDCWNYTDPTIFFDTESANAALLFIRTHCTHVEGILKGKPFIPEPWQEAIIGCIFGFFKTRSDDNRIIRRYKEVFIYVPRKNGKTPLVCAMVLYEFFCSAEQSQQGFVGAGNKEQANIFSRTLTGMIDNNPVLSSMVQIFGGDKSATPLSARSVTVKRLDDGSFIKTISSVGDTKHGFNVNLVVVEEVHTHKFRDLYDALQTAMVSCNRISPLLIGISTADSDRPSICNEKLDTAYEVMKNPSGFDTFLPVIYETKKHEDWKDEKVWKKCNPNLGISVSLDTLRDECKKAIINPAYAVKFKRLHLNMKVLEFTKAFDGINTKTDLEGLTPMEWRKEFLKQCKGIHCIAGFDLSSTNDICAYVQLFRDIPGFKRYVAIPYFWVSQTALQEPKIHSRRRNLGNFMGWIDIGWIQLINKPTIHYPTVLEDIETISQLNQPEYIIADVLFQGLQACQELQDKGYDVETFKNNFAQHTLPTKHLLELMANGEIEYGNNPVLTWMLGNAVTETNSAGYIRFNKEKSPDKIDGVIGLIMALNKYMFLDLKGIKRKTVYSKRGIKAL